MDTLPEQAKHGEVERDRTDEELAVSTYDRVSSLLIALLILTGAGVLGLVVVVYSIGAFGPKDPPLFGRGGATGIDLGYAESDLDEDPFGGGLDESDGESHLQEWSPADLKKLVVQLEGKVPQGAPKPSRNRSGSGEREGPPGAPIEERVPRHERWEIRFQGVDLEEYARQLDFFKIELAVLEKQANLVRYASQVSDDRPETRTGPPKDEKRLYMIWQGGPLAAADRKLLRKAGTETTGKISLQFFPAETEARLAEKEKQAAGERGVNDIRKTIFGTEKEGDGYAFFVIRQRFFAHQ